MRSRRGWRSARRSTPQKPVEIAQIRRSWKIRMRGDDVDLTRFPAPVWHARGWRPLYRLRQPRRHARSRRRLDQRLDLSRAGPRPRPRDDPVRPWRPPRRDHRAQILGTRRGLPGRGGVRRRTRRCSSPGSSICRRASSEYDFAGAIKGAPIEIASGPGRPGCRSRPMPRSCSKAASAVRRDIADGRAVRRVHRLFRSGHSGPAR